MIDTTKLVEGERYLVTSAALGELGIAVYLGDDDWLDDGSGAVGKTSQLASAVPVALAMKAVEMREMLKQLEFVRGSDEKPALFCPCCDERPHAKDCELAALIADAGGGVA